jgi:hypothetical protein
MVKLIAEDSNGFRPIREVSEDLQQQKYENSSLCKLFMLTKTTLSRRLGIWGGAVVSGTSPRSGCGGIGLLQGVSHDNLRYA